MRGYMVNNQLLLYDMLIINAIKNYKIFKKNYYWTKFD